MSRKDPFDRPYRKGVGAVLFNPQGLVFVARRIDMTAEAWQLPQGGIDDGEKAKDAVLRELQEEIGTDKAAIIGATAAWLRYDLPVHLLDQVWGGKYRGQEQQWYALRFQGTDGDIDLNATDHPEFDAWRWAPLASIPDFAVVFKRALYEQLVSEFATFAVPADDVTRAGQGL